VQGRKENTMASWSKQQEPVTNPYESRPVPGVIPPPPARAEQPTAAVAPTAPTAATKRDEAKTEESSGDLLLGAGVQFEGKLTFKGTVRIDAKFTGSIVTNDVLVVGERAKIDAEITCGTVVVEGEVNGNVKAKSAVELHRSAKVRGNVETASLSVEKGALLQGEVKMMTGEKSSKSSDASTLQ
jgi:cytoskeletal protein CcmA (bactofilin family)